MYFDMEFHSKRSAEAQSIGQQFNLFHIIHFLIDELKLEHS